MRRLVQIAKWLLVGAGAVSTFMFAVAGSHPATCKNFICWHEVIYTCAGTSPNCVGGCWWTGSYPCDVCEESPTGSCQLQTKDVNAGL